LVGSKEIGLEVSADKIKYMTMSRDQNAGRNHGIKFDNSSFKNVEVFKYFGTKSKSKFYSEINWEHTAMRQYMTSFGAESFVFQFFIQKYKD